MGDEERALTRRIMSAAAKKYGSSARLAVHLNVTYAEFLSYVTGQEIPPEKVFLRAVEVILDELPAIRLDFSQQAWRALSLPK